MEELKPCPFCGGKAEVRKDLSFVTCRSVVYRVHCLTPECPMRSGYVYFTENDAASAWNGRTE